MSNEELYVESVYSTPSTPIQPITVSFNSDPYSNLKNILDRALEQASGGKGKERHAYSESERFENQLICEMARRLGATTAGPLYQAVKKCYESIRLEPSKAKHELYGAINYIAAAIQILDEKEKQ